MAVIPVRLASRRFPRKALAPMDGMPLVRHVVEWTCAEEGVDEVLVATDSEEVAEAAGDVRVVMTPSDFVCGSDRVGYAARAEEADVVLNVQCDLLDVARGTLAKLVDALEEPWDMTTPAFATSEDCSSSDEVKVVTAVDGRALYFSRSLVPHADGKVERLVHVGIYCFTAEALSRFTALGPSRLEGVERLEQLRALENGMSIRVVRLAERARSVERLT